MASALDQLEQLNQMFRAQLQPVYDYSNARIALAQMNNARAYQHAMHERYRQEGHEDEQRMYDLGRQRLASQARGELAQLGKTPQEIGALNDEQAIYLAGELARTHQIRSDAQTQIDVQRTQQAKQARGVLAQSGMTPEQLAKLTDDEAIFKADVARQQAGERAKIAVQNEVPAGDLSKMAAILRSVGQDPSKMTPDQVRDAYNQFDATRQFQIRGAQSAAAYEIAQRIKGIQDQMAQYSGGFNRTNALRTLLNGQTTAAGTKITPNSPEADVDAYLSSLDKGKKAALDMKLDEMEGEFNKSAPMFSRSLALELYHAQNDLERLTSQGIVPIPQSGYSGFINGVTPAKAAPPPALRPNPAPAGAPQNPYAFLQNRGIVPGGASATAPAPAPTVAAPAPSPAASTTAAPGGPSAFDDAMRAVGFGGATNADYQIDPVAMRQMIAAGVARGQSVQDAFSDAFKTLRAYSSVQNQRAALGRLQDDMASSPQPSATLFPN